MITIKMAATGGTVNVKAEPYTSFNGGHNDARLNALLVEAQLYQQLQETSVQLKHFKRKVQKRLKDQRYLQKTGGTERDGENVILVEKHAIPTQEKEDSSIIQPETTPLDSTHHDITVITTCRKERKQCYEEMLSLCEKPCEPNGKSGGSPKCDNNKLFQLKHGVVIKTGDSKKGLINKGHSSNKTELAAHHLTIRRMYSALERQQSRVNALNREQQRGAERRRQEREEERRRIESQYPSSLTSDEREKAVRWLEMIALERREQKLTKQKDTKRFCEALQFLLHEKHPSLPSLCPCHPTIWDTDPMKCAVNCPFYRNHSKFAKELSSLLQSINSK